MSPYRIKPNYWWPDLTPRPPRDVFVELDRFIEDERRALRQPRHIELDAATMRLWLAKMRWLGCAPQPARTRGYYYRGIKLTVRFGVTETLMQAHYE